MVEYSKKISDEISKNTGFSDLARLLRELKKYFEEVDGTTKVYKKTLTDLERANASYKKALSEDAVEIQKVRYETTELNKANKDNAKETLGVVTAYQKFAKQVNEAKNRAKSLGAEMILLEQSFKRGDITSRQYNAQLNKLSKEYVEASVKAKGLDTAIKKIDSSVGDSQRNVGNYKSALGGLTSSFKGLLAAVGVVGGIQLFGDLLRSSYDTIKTLNAQNYALKQVFETEAQVAFQKEYLTKVTDQYGLSLVSTAEDYTKFSAAVRGTALEGEAARNIFESFSGASSKLGLNAEQNTGIFKALEQMISKGTIQAEELRGQLGDRMPGAFKLFADAMGVSTNELGKLLKEGKVLSADVLPKVAEELNRAYNLDNATKADTIAAAQARLTNTWTSFLDALTNDKDIVNGLAEGLETLGSVLNFVLDTLISDGTDGVSVLGDVVDIIGTLTGAVADIATGLGLMDEKTKNNLFSLRQFKNDLQAIQSVISVLSGLVKAVTEQFVGFFSTMFQNDGWDKYMGIIKKSNQEFQKLTDNYNNLQSGLAKANAQDKVYSKVGDDYAQAWRNATKEKQSYFQLNGKYFDTKTGKNTGKSLDDYIDRGGKLVLKDKTPASIPIAGNNDDKKAESARKKAIKDVQRASDLARKLAFENAKAEIEAQKLSLDFLQKSFEVENKLTSEKEIFYSYYYDRKFALLEKERDLELSVAKTIGERKKIEARFALDELSLIQEKDDRIKAMRVRAIDNEKALYEAQNKSILELGLELTDGLIEIEKTRLDQITNLELRSLEEKFKLNEKNVLEKVKSNEKLTDAEADFYVQSLNIHKSNAEAKKDVNREYYDETKKHLEALISIEQLKRGKFYEEDTDLLLKHEDDLFKIHMDGLLQRLQLGEIKQQEYNDEAEMAELLHQENMNRIRQEGFERALEMQSEFVSNINEIKQIGVAFDQLMTAKTTEDFMTGLSKMAGGIKSFAKEGSATWKALAVFQASLNMYVGISQALKEPTMVKRLIGIALATSTGFMALSNIKNTPNPKYKDGTLFAERTTTAITDEEGPELHFDKNWKLKDKGSSFGPRFKSVTRGDKIIPADISKMINSNHLSSLKVENNTPMIDYAKLSKMIAKESALANENIKREHFVPMDGEIIRIETKGGVRTIFKSKSDKPTGQRLS